ncbi:MAG: dTMP kinase [Fibrobacter sp.]|nr:dTMP kinase [Fibrobacter sp.]
MKRGLFITFEGIDGCGKSTQLSLAARSLRERGLDVVVTREPGGTPIAEKIREILISPENSEMVNECELLLYLAARAQHVHQTIIPALEEGKIILCDRFQEATFAYQGFGRSFSLKLLKDLNAFATGSLNSDCTLIFDISEQVSRIRLEAINKGKDRLEQNGIEFFKRIRNGYHELAKAEPSRIVLIDGERSISEVSDLVRSRIDALLQSRGN